MEILGKDFKKEEAVVKSNVSTKELLRSGEAAHGSTTVDL
jgi:hypothetical protein